MNTDNLHRPAVLWVVTKRRTRQGLPPFKITPYEWRHNNGKLQMVAAIINHQTQIYYIGDCTETIEDAERLVGEQVRRIAQQAQIQVDNLTKRLRKAKKATAELRRQTLQTGARTMTGYKRITKKEFYAAGGFSSPRLMRTTSGQQWAYWSRCD